ncbi:MAG: hypothetical protein HRU30_15595 [Rhodobacteraceae bacterium]|nr:hypothetical protein [Paracoccaceae bacterium]
MKRLSILATCLAIAGCTVIESNRAGVPFLTESGAKKRTQYQGSYSLPRRYLTFKILGDHRHFNLSEHFAVTQATPAAELVPDPSAGFRFDVNYAPSRFSRDNVTVEMADQMLSTVTIATSDATDDVLVNFAQAAAQIARLSSGLTTAPRTNSTFDTPGASSSTSKIEKVVAQLSFDPTDVASVNRAKKRLGHKMNLRITPAPRAVTRFPDCEFALCYRPLTTVLVSFEEPHSGNSTDFLVKVPDPHQIAGIDLERSAFVDRTTTLTFSGGTLQKIDMEKPSELAEAALLPVKIIDAVFTGVGNAVTGLLGVQKNELDGSANLLKAQAEYLDALVAYRKTLESAGLNETQDNRSNGGPATFRTPGGQATLRKEGDGETQSTQSQQSGTVGTFAGEDVTVGAASGGENATGDRRLIVLDCPAQQPCAVVGN